MIYKLSSKILDNKKIYKNIVTIIIFNLYIYIILEKIYDFKIMNYLEYLPIFVFIIIAVGLSAGFALLSGFVGPNNPDKEKLICL